MFCSNVSGGITKTIAPERWVNSWENNYKLALLSEEAGIDFLLPLANWYGLGGDAPSEGDTLEAITWATGLLAKTRAITIFTTIHVPFMHPIFAAKQVVTADHIGQGRLGLNVVSGSVPEEFSLFGVPMLPHDERYAVTEEWLAVMVSHADLDLCNILIHPWSADEGVVHGDARTIRVAIVETEAGGFDRVAQGIHRKDGAGESESAGIHSRQRIELQPLAAGSRQEVGKQHIHELGVGMGPGKCLDIRNMD